MKRRFVKVSSDGDYIWAVADDGTAWWRRIADGNEWHQLAPLPDVESDKLPRYRLDDEERDR